MQIGGYIVVVEGTETPLEYELIGTAGHPTLGEELVLDSAQYVVTRVRHEEDAEARTVARYTYPRVFVRVTGGKGRQRPSTDTELAVVPYAPPGEESRHASAILPPSLVAVLVAAGYAEQKLAFRGGSRQLAQLRRCGGRWMTLTSRDLWSLSRRAKRFMLDAAAFAAALSSDDLTWSWSSETGTLQVSEEPSFPREMPRDALRPTRPARPVLRLV
jgi:hypothetical protein